MDTDESVDVKSTSQTADMLNLCDEVASTCKKFRGLLEKYENLLSSYNAKVLIYPNCRMSFLV